MGIDGVDGVNPTGGPAERLRRLLDLRAGEAEAVALAVVAGVFRNAAGTVLILVVVGAVWCRVRPVST